MVKIKMIQGENIEFKIPLEIEENRVNIMQTMKTFFMPEICLREARYPGERKWRKWPKYGI